MDGFEIAKVLKEYDEKHKKLERKLLNCWQNSGRIEGAGKDSDCIFLDQHGDEIDDQDDASQIAKIMTDGCNRNQKPYGKDQPVFRCLQESISLAKTLSNARKLSGMI